MARRLAAILVLMSRSTAASWASVYAINMAARLLHAASASEIAVSNIYYQGLDEASQGDFVELEDIEAHNLGCINAWKWHYKQ